MKNRFRFFPLALLLCTSAFAQTSKANYANVTQYIAKSWDTLTRSMDHCETVLDPKMPTRSLVYVPAGYPVGDRLQRLAARCKVKVLPLPQKITQPGQFPLSRLRQHGLLFLPHPYVVPGGFFNEMYGWDSYFIILGLIDDGRLDLARGMAENFFFEIENYGAVLNANRTYYLTRSQPPFLSSMVMAIYQAQRKAGHDDRQWLARAYDSIVRDHAMWT